MSGRSSVGAVMGAVVGGGGGAMSLPTGRLLAEPGIQRIVLRTGSTGPNEVGFGKTISSPGPLSMLFCE